MDAVGQTALGAGIGILWQGARTDTGSSESFEARTFVVAAVVSAIASGAFTAWGSTLIGQARFFPDVVVVTVGYLAAALLVGGVLLVSSWSRYGREFSTSLGRDTDRIPSGRVSTLLEPAALAVAWFVSGSLASAGFQTLGLIPPDLFRLRGLSLVVPVTRFAQLPWVVTGVQGALGGVFVVLLMRWAWRGSDSR